MSGKGAFILALAAVCLLGLLNALGAAGRPLWMDETITMTSFATRPTLLSTYLSYDIPNNHIVYTMMISLLMDFMDKFGIATGALLRLPSLVFGVAALALVFLLAALRGSLTAGLALALFLAMSATFSTYATAVRGYMLAFLCVAAAIWLSDSLLRRGGLWRFAAYFSLCLVAVGTLPTDVIALGAVAIAALSKRRLRRLPRLGWLFAAPVLALGVFYLPILPKFIKCMTLGEGWPSSAGAAWNLYGSFAFAFLPLLPLCAWGAALLWRRRPAARLPLLLSLAVLLLPLPFIFLGGTTPFPRVFLPLWPLWLVLLARPLGLGFSELKRRFPGLNLVLVSGLALCLWTSLMIQGREPIRDAAFGDGFHDDLFMPFYLEQSYRPDLVSKRIAGLFKESPPFKVFVSFRADHFTLPFYGAADGLPKELWLHDSPKYGKMPALPDDTDILLVCAGKGDLEATLSRFGLKEAGLVQDMGFQQIYSIPRKAGP